MAQFPRRRDNAVAIGVFSAVAFAALLLVGVLFYGGRSTGASRVPANMAMPTNQEVVERMKEYYRNTGAPFTASVYHPRKVTAQFRSRHGVPITDTRIIVPAIEVTSSGRVSVMGYGISRNRSGHLDVHIEKVLDEDGVRWVAPPFDKSTPILKF